MNLINAAREAIRDVGLPAVTAREIAGRASANLASIPYHFGSKDALVAEALIAEVTEFVGPVLQLLASDKPAPQRAAEGVALLNGFFEARQSQVPAYLAALAAAPHATEISEALGGLWSELRAHLAADIGRQLDAGQLPAWVSPPAMAALILSVVNGVIIASVLDRDGPDNRAIATQFLSLLLAAGATPVVIKPSTGLKG